MHWRRDICKYFLKILLLYLLRNNSHHPKKKRGHSNQHETLLVLEQDENDEYKKYVLATGLDNTIWSEKCVVMIFRLDKLRNMQSVAAIDSADYTKVSNKVAIVKINLENIKLQEIESAFKECGERNNSIRADLTILCNSVKDGTPLPQDCKYLSDRTKECQQKMMDNEQTKENRWRRKLATSITSDNLNMFECLFEGNLSDAKDEKIQATLKMIAGKALETDPNTLKVKHDQAKNTIGGKPVIDHVQDGINTLKGMYLARGESSKVDAIHSLVTSGIGDDNDESDDEEAIEELATKIAAIILGTDDEPTAKADNETEDSEMAEAAVDLEAVEKEEEAEEIIEDVEEAAAEKAAPVLEELKASDAKIDTAAGDAPVESPSDEADGNVWTCHECTYANEDAHVRQCQMCSEPNPNYKRRKPRRRS